MRRFHVACTDVDNDIFTTAVVLYDDERANEDTFRNKVIDTANVPFPYEILSWSLVEE